MLRSGLIIILLNLLGAVGMRLMYRYCYRFGVRRTKKGEFLRWLLLLFAGDNVIKERRNENKRIRIAILGAGRLGAVLADELLSNDSAAYVPVCFIDQDSTKTGREVMGLPVLAFIDSAAPPRASPSSLERMTPSMSRYSLNVCAALTAS